MIPFYARDIAVAYAAGVAFTLGAITPLVALAGLAAFLWRPRRK